MDNKKYYNSQYFIKITTKYIRKLIQRFIHSWEQIQTYISGHSKYAIRK